MSSNPFTNNNPFANSQQKPNNIFGAPSQTNIFNNTSNNGAKIEIKNPVFNQQNNSNPFKSNNEPNLNSFNNKNNQNENSKNNQNNFFLFNTQQSQKSKEQNSALNTNININQNIKNSTILNINSINNNNNTNNSNQNTSNMFTNAPNKSNIFINNTTNNSNNKPNTINIVFQKNNQEAKKEEKKESNIFLTQSNNILNKSNNFPSQNQIVNNSIISQEQKNENKISNILNPNQEKKEKSKVNEFINSLLADDKLIFSEKEKKEYEKNQLSFKLNAEICEDFKNMLFNQKEKFEKYTFNARIIDKKFMNLINKMKNNATESLNNEIRFRNLFEKIKSTEKKVSNLKYNMNQKDKAITKGLDFIKKNLYNDNNGNNNNLTLMKNNNLQEKIKIFYDLNETADKIRNIDNNLNIIWNSFNQNDKNTNEISFIDTDKEYENKKEKNNLILNNNFILNNNINKVLLDKNNFIWNNEIDGVFLERDNLDNRDNNKQILYVEQKDINNLFTECYDGLYCQKCIQDEFDIKYNALKNKLIDKINQSNNNLGKDNIQKRDVEMEFNI